MPTNVPHILLTAHGTMPGGELWSCGLRSYHTPTFLSPASGAALANAAAERWMTFRNSRNELFADHVTNSARLSGVTLRELNEAGVTVSQYEGIPTTVNTASTHWATAGNQNALAVTLVSDRAGRTGKGRIYVPCLNVGNEFLLVAGQLQAATLTTLLPSVKTLIDGLNTDLTTHYGSTLKLSVQSPKAAAGHIAGDLESYNGAVITSIKLGSVIDTQRRRRASIAENYAVALVA